MPRDRLATLRAIQRQEHDAYNRYSNEERHDTFPGSDAEVIEMTLLLPDDDLGQFLMQVEDIRELLGEFKNDVELVKEKHSDILTSPYTDDPRRKELDDLISQIKTKTTRIHSKLKDIEMKIQNEDEEADKYYSTGTLRIKKTQHSALIRLFIDTMNDYHLAQANYRDRSKERIKRQLEITRTFLDDEEIDKMMEERNWSVFTQGIITDTAQAKEMLVEIETRHKDILQLEKSIRDLHEMFVELALLVERQGYQIDQIEKHVNDAREHVDKANNEINEARHYKCREKKNQIRIILIIAVVILALVLIIIFR